MKLIKTLTIGLLASSFIIGTALANKREVPQFIDGTVRVSAEEIIDLVVQYDELVIIDSRKKIDVAKGFIEGSISLPNTETNSTSLANHIVSKTTPVLFYCNGNKCRRSLKAARIAVANGYSKIYWFRGGMQEWEAKGLPVVQP